MGAVTSDPHRHGARALAADAAVAALVPRFAAAGIDVLLLRGPAIAARLHDPGELRPYNDVDLLVAPASWEAARQVLAAAGLTPPLGGRALPSGMTDHAESWGWASAGTSVDLHRRVDGMPLDAAWTALAQGAAPLPVGGAAVLAPDAAGVALVVALHAAQHGRGDARVMDDLGRAVARLDEDVWRTALARARAADVERFLAAALAFTPEGAALAAALGAEGAPAGAGERLRLGTPPHGAFTVAHLGELPLARRPGYLARKVVPHPEFMRAQWPLARRGRAGLTAAYVQRLGWMARRAPAAVRAWRRAQRP